MYNNKTIHHLLNLNYEPIIRPLHGTSFTSHNKPVTQLSSSTFSKWKQLKLRESKLPKFMYLLRGWARIWLLMSEAEVKVYALFTISHFLPKKLMGSWIYTDFLQKFQGSFWFELYHKIFFINLSCLLKGHACSACIQLLTHPPRALPNSWPLSPLSSSPFLCMAKCFWILLIIPSFLDDLDSTFMEQSFCLLKSSSCVRPLLFRISYLWKSVIFNSMTLALSVFIFFTTLASPSVGRNLYALWSSRKAISFPFPFSLFSYY